MGAGWAPGERGRDISTLVSGSIGERPGHVQR